MADGKKSYIIEINGIKESIDAVKALNEQLATLETRVNSLQNKVVNVTTNTTTNTTTNQDSSSRTSALKEEDSLLKQIEQTEQKIAEVRRDEYQELLNQKEILKESKKEASSRFAEDNLALKEYDNTMQGVKEHLADLKKAMQTKDMDSDEFKQMAQQANELNTKLKEAEQSYGQFGRNVGNYANGVAEGLQGVVIKVGDTERTFTSAKQAAKELGNELKTMAVNGKQGTQEYQELDKAVKTLESTMKDVSKSSVAMDKLLDTMQGIIAIASTAKGIGALFGFDGNEIEQSIQKLVALQNALKGIETISQQMKTGEGIGGWLSKGNAAIDAFTNKLFGLNKQVKATNTELIATGTAGKTASTGLGTASVAANTASKSFRLAEVSAKALGVALKAIGIGLAIAAITLLVEGISKLVSMQKEAKKYQEDLNKASEDGQKAYAKTVAELSIYQTKIDKFNGSKKQEKKLVEELNSKYGQSLGQYKTLAEWKKILAEKGKILAQVMAKEAEMQAILNMYTENYIRLQQAKQDESKTGIWASVKRIFTPITSSSQFIEAQGNEMLEKLKELQGEINNLNEAAGLFNYAPQIEKNSKKTEDALKKAQNNIIALQLELMKDGLNKTIAQLEVERIKRIEEAKKTEKLVAEQTELINKLYRRKEFEAMKAHYEKLLSIREQYNEDLKKLQEETLSEGIQNSIQKNENEFENAKEFLTIVNELSGDTRYFTNILTIDYSNANINEYIIETYKNAQKLKQTADELEKIYARFNKDAKLGNPFSNSIDFVYDFEKYADKMSEEERKYISGLIKTFNEARSSVKAYNEAETVNLKDQLETRLEARQLYYDNVLKATKSFYDKELEIQNTALSKQIEKERENENKRYEKMVGNNRKNTIIEDLLKGYKESLGTTELNGLNTKQIEQYFSKYKEELDKWLEEQDKAFEKGEISIEEYVKRTNGTLLQSYRNRDITFVQFMDNMVKQDEAHQNKMSVIETKSATESEKLEKEHLRNLQTANSQYYSNLEREISNFATAVNRLRDKVVKNNNWDIFNYKEAKKKLKELQSSISVALAGISQSKIDLFNSLASGDISFEDYDAAIERVNSLQSELKGAAGGVQSELDELFGKWWSGIDYYVQQVGAAAVSILSSISEIQSNQYDKMISEQEKYIEQYEELLDKQKDATQEYADAVKSIEDELSTARGDRRQQLIDNLNAEMAAQRASLAQEKKIEKEKEKAEERKKKLEHDQAVAKKKMDLAQAYINAAMAVSMAAVNKWPVPAIPMMALAAAVGAAQIAAVASQNIPSYGSGGVIQGKSHRQGGVKVLGGQAEVEGGEFITNKVTTANNVDVLEYINSKKRKLDINDFIDFYSSATTKKRILSVSPRTRFEDGGVIPTLRTDIDLSDRMLNAFEDYSNRPVVVSVVDINDRQAAVNNVKVLAGMDI